jgi:hypothetical protein
MNDAAMQALGSYDGGRMLFLGLGTGLGSTMIVDGVIVPMELGHLPFRRATFEEYVGRAARQRLGPSAGVLPRWRPSSICRRRSCRHYVVLGGGLADELGRPARGRPWSARKRARVRRRLPALGVGCRSDLAEIRGDAALTGCLSITALKAQIPAHAR